MSRTLARVASVCALSAAGACHGAPGAVDASVEASTQDSARPPHDDGPGDAAVATDAPATPTDAADASDAGHDAAVASPCGSALFCEPFDTYGAMTLHDGQLFGPWRATLQTPGSTMGLDGTHTVSGPRALHVHIDNAVTAGGRLYSHGTLPVLAGNPTHVYGRMMMYIDPNGSSVHWTFFGVNGPAVMDTPVAGREASYLISSLPRSNINTYAFVDGLAAAGSDPYHDCYNPGTTPMPTATWSCLAFEFDSVARRLRLTMDGGPTAIVSVDDHGQGCVGTVVPQTAPWYGPAINQFYTGAWSFHAMTGPLDVWIDDVVLDTSPVACPAR